MVRKQGGHGSASLDVGNQPRHPRRAGVAPEGSRFAILPSAWVPLYPLQPIPLKFDRWRACNVSPSLSFFSRRVRLPAAATLRDCISQRRCRGHPLPRSAQAPRRIALPFFRKARQTRRLTRHSRTKPEASESLDVISRTFSDQSRSRRAAPSCRPGGSEKSSQSSVRTRTTQSCPALLNRAIDTFFENFAKYPETAFDDQL
jgi:hypothetical protein